MLVRKERRMLRARSPPPRILTRSGSCESSDLRGRPAFALASDRGAVIKAAGDAAAS